MSSKSCPKNKINNPKTGRCVIRSGKAGKKILANKKKPGAKKKPGVKKPSTKKPGVKKPSTKPGVKKPSTKKPGVKKPSTKKPNVKKPGVKKSGLGPLGGKQIKIFDIPVISDSELTSGLKKKQKDCSEKSFLTQLYNTVFGNDEPSKQWCEVFLNVPDEEYRENQRLLKYSKEITSNLTSSVPNCPVKNRQIKYKYTMPYCDVVEWSKKTAFSDIGYHATTKSIARKIFKGGFKPYSLFTYGNIHQTLQVSLETKLSSERIIILAKFNVSKTF